MDVRVVPLADRLDLVDVVASWHWEQWGADDPDGSLESWTARLGSWANGDAIPSLYVALDEGRPAGSVSLVAHDLPEERDLWDLWPWLSGLFVVPDRRGRGLARALVAHVEHAARHLGVSRLYLHTVDACGLYEHLGWEVIGRLPVAGRLVDLMAKRLIPGSEDPTEQAWLRTLRPSRIRDVQAGELSWTTVDVVDCTSGDEAGAIRAVLEHLGVRVNLARVGQARHLIHALERGDAAWLVLCVQGDGGRILLPDLAPQVERFQPWHGSVGPAEIAASFGRPGCQVFCTGGETGTEELATAFLDAGASSYLAPAGAPFGYASMVVVALVFYGLVSGGDVAQAVEKVTVIDDELAMWRLWSASRAGRVQR